jgi:hypothetical protein
MALRKAVFSGELFEVRGGTFWENLIVSWPLCSMRVWPDTLQISSFEVPGLEVLAFKKIEIPKENIMEIGLSGSWNAWLPAYGIWIDFSKNRRRRIAFFPFKPRELARRLASSGYPVRDCQPPAEGTLRRALSTRARALATSLLVLAGLSALTLWLRSASSLFVAALPVWVLFVCYLYRYLRDV